MTRIGIIGCGNIFDRYATGLACFEALDLVWCADIDTSLAEKAAAEHGIAHHGSPDDLLGDPSVEIVINITPPAVHGAVTRSIAASGKHVYVEKPLDVSVAAAREQMDVVRSSGVRLGVAPDTFLGSAAQTARAAVDRGDIGDPIGAALFVSHSKAETWHPNPTFLFQAGGGPVLDLGPYHITHLVNVLGPVAEVFSRTRIGAPTRTVTAPGRTIESITVSTDTHAAAVLTLQSGVLASVQMSFDVWDHSLPFLEIYGSAGTLSLPDPNQFDGPVSWKRHEDRNWQELAPSIPPVFGPAFKEQLQRGPGVADLAASLRGAPQRANAELGLHVLEVLEAIGSGGLTSIATTCSRPTPIDDRK